MIKKIVSCFLFLTVIFLVGSVKPSLADNPEAPQEPDKINIENTYENSKKYEHTLFSHKKHAEEYKNPKGEKITCDSCHHVYKDGKNVWKKGDKISKCNSCHKGSKNLSLKTAEKLPEKEMILELSEVKQQYQVPQ